MTCDVSCSPTCTIRTRHSKRPTASDEKSTCCRPGSQVWFRFRVFGMHLHFLDLNSQKLTETQETCLDPLQMSSHVKLEFQELRSLTTLQGPTVKTPGSKLQLHSEAPSKTSNRGFHAVRRPHPTFIYPFPQAKPTRCRSFDRSHPFSSWNSTIVFRSVLPIPVLVLTSTLVGANACS